MATTPAPVTTDAFTTNGFGDIIVDELYLASLMCFGGGFLARVETDATGRSAKFFVKMDIEDARTESIRYWFSTRIYTQPVVGLRTSML
jgi:hypothetical protein